MHRQKRDYLRPADHPGPETVLVGEKRVKRGEVFSLHTSDQEHVALLMDGYQSTMVSTAQPVQFEHTPRRKKGEPDAEL